MSKTPTEDIAEFYNHRGMARLTSSDIKIGSDAISYHLRAPYVFAEDLLKDRFRFGARKLLDLCCGTGIHGITAARIGYHVMGVDISLLSIDAAKSLAIRHSVSQITEFSRGSALEYLNHTVDNRFDIIFMSGSAYYFPRQELLDAIVRCLAPGGVFICIETFGDNKLMNTIRWARAIAEPSRRDNQTMKNLLTAHDIAYFQSRFSRSHVQYFDFLSLGGSLLKRFPRLEKLYCRLSWLLDKLVLNRFGLKSLAFKFVFMGEKYHLSE